MKVQTNYSHYIPDKGKPAFGNYVIDKRIGRAVGVLVPKDIKTFYALGKNNGENLNNTVTAVGTAGVAPIFIRFNPLSDEDPKVKAYSALRQPLSAVLARGVQLPVMTAYNYLLDKWATSGKVRRIDLSAKPPEAVLRSYAKSRYNQELREFLAAGNSVDDLEKNFYKGRNKQQYIEDIIQEARNNIFYAQRDKMRRLAKEDLPITTSVLRDENGKVKDWFHPTKLSEIKDIEFVKPDELDKARKDVYAQVLKEFGVNPDDKKLRYTDASKTLSDNHPEVTVFNPETAQEAVYSSSVENYYRANGIFGDTATKQKEYPNQRFDESRINNRTKSTEGVEDVTLDINGFFVEKTARDAKMADIFAKQIGTWMSDGKVVGGGFALEKTDAYKMALQVNSDDYTIRETEYKGQKEQHAYFDTAKSDDLVTLFSTEVIDGKEYIAIRDDSDVIHYFDKSDNLKEVKLDI